MMTREQISEIVGQILADYLRLSVGEVRANSHVVNDLGADSLALVELGFKFMEAFGTPMIAQEDSLLIVGNLVDHIHQLRNS